MNSTVVQLIGMCIILAVANVLAWVQCFQAQRRSQEILGLFKETQNETGRYYSLWRAASDERIRLKLELENCQSQNRVLLKKLRERETAEAQKEGEKS